MGGGLLGLEAENHIPGTNFIPCMERKLIGQIGETRIKHQARKPK